MAGAREMRERVARDTLLDPVRRDPGFVKLMSQLEAQDLASRVTSSPQ